MPSVRQAHHPRRRHAGFERFRLCLGCNCGPGFESRSFDRDHCRAGLQNWAEARRWRELERECVCTFVAPHGLPESPEEDGRPLAHTRPKAPQESPAGLYVYPARPFPTLAGPSPAVPESAVAYPAGTSFVALRVFVSVRSVRCSGRRGSCRSTRTNTRRPGIPIQLLCRDSGIRPS